MKVCFKINTDVCMVRTRMHSFVPFFIAKETNTCILGRMYFIERSIYFKSIHLTINNFTGAQALGVIIDRLLRQCCFLWSKLYIYILIKKQTNKQTEIQSIVLMECSVKEVLDSFFFIFSRFKCIVHVLCFHVLSFSQWTMHA